MFRSIKKAVSWVFGWVGVILCSTSVLVAFLGAAVGVIVFLIVFVPCLIVGLFGMTIMVNPVTQLAKAVTETMDELKEKVDGCQ